MLPHTFFSSCAFTVGIFFIALNAAAQSSQTIEPITVRGDRPSSIPSQIPTTVESISRSEIAATINATDAEDALKYFPSLTVRKRYAGDFDHAVLATRASGTGNSARSLVYADGILLSNLLGNGASFTPRWALVSPEEIDRVDVLYGPFSAAYSGNSVGAVVDYVTRMPQKFEAFFSTSGVIQPHHLYGTNASFAGGNVSAALGNRSGAWSWWVNANRADQSSQPLAFATKLVSAGLAGGAGTSVMGAIPGQNPRGQDWLLLAATSQYDTVQDHAKAKIAYDFSSTLRAQFIAGLWSNSAERSVASFLRDTSGNAVYAGSVNVSGRQFTISPTEISPAIQDLRHEVFALSVKERAESGLGWELAASQYRYARDLSRTPTIALPAAQFGGAGRLTNQSGTGWTTLAAKGVWKSAANEHIVDFGVQRDAFVLQTRVENLASDWQSLSEGALFSKFAGKSELISLYAQDTWQLSPAWKTTLGLRSEQWQALDGLIATGAQSVSLASRKENFVSPKAAVQWQLNSDWQLKGSLGRAVRMPTVSELYQGSIATNVVVNNDPNLQPEKSITSELSAIAKWETLSLRGTLFHERTRDALYSQTNVSIVPNITNIQNVGAIRTSGAELVAHAQAVFWPELELTASVTFVDSIITANDKFPASVGKWQPRVPRWRANAVATYRIANQWSGTLGIRHSGKQFGTLDNADFNPNVYTAVSPYTVADLRVRYDSGRQWSSAVGVDNVGNKTYWAFHPYPQRTFFAELKFKFD